MAGGGTSTGLGTSSNSVPPPPQFVVSMGPGDLSKLKTEPSVGQIHVPSLGGGLLDVATKLKVCLFVHSPAFEAGPYVEKLNMHLQIMYVHMTSEVLSRLQRFSRKQLVTA